MKPPIIQINDFKGGMTLNEKMGREDSFHIGKGLDFFSQPGFLAPGYAFRNMTLAGLETLPTEFNWILFANQDGRNYFGGENGIIYRQTASDNTAIEAVNTALSSIRGMAEYKGYLYYAQDTNLGRYDFTTFTNNWQTLNSATYHPIVVQAKKLYIGNGQYLASYDGTNWNANALDLDTGWTIRSLSPFGVMYLAIGANFGNVKCKIFLWNRTDPSWTDEIDIPENTILAQVYDSGYLWVVAGSSANLYVIPEGSRKATKIWSFSREDPSINFEVYPGAIAVRKGTVFLGLSNVDQRSALKNPAAIYSFPVEPNKFTLNIPFKDQGYRERYKSLAIMGTTNTLYSSFRSEVSAGGEYNNLKREKNVDEAAPYDAIQEYESFYFKAPKDKKILTEKFGIQFQPLPPGTQTSLYYKKDNDTTWTSVISNFSTPNTTEIKVDKRVEANRLKLKLEIRGSTTTTDRQFIDSIYVTGDIIDKN